MTALLAVTGCGDSTPGGPGAKPPTPVTPADSPGGGTFTLSGIPGAVTLKQGEAKAFTVTIARKDNFREAVKLEFTGLPKGASIDPAHPAIAAGDADAKFTLKADDEAALGEFAVKMVGHPGRGLDSTSDLKVTIEKK